ncbi:hypothetical protein [Bacillus sp. FJAT-53711]
MKERLDDFMKKTAWLLCFCFLITCWNLKSPVAFAKEGQVFTFVVDQPALLHFLKATSQEYTNAMKKGVTLAEFASRKGISESKLIHYFAIRRQKQMDLALKKGQIDQGMYEGLLIDMNHGISKAINYNPQAFK